MIRIVCPSCRHRLPSDAVGQAITEGRLSLVCPQCAEVLLTEPPEDLTRAAVVDEVHA